VEEVTHKGESKSLCVSLCSWLTDFIHTQKGGFGGAEPATSHKHTHTDLLLHTPYLLDRYGEKV